MRKWKPSKAQLAKWQRERAASFEFLSLAWCEYYGTCPHQFDSKGVCSKCGIGSLLKEKRKRSR